jgi:hypothetical protein
LDRKVREGSSPSARTPFLSVPGKGGHLVPPPVSDGLGLCPGFAEAAEYGWVAQMNVLFVFAGRVRPQVLSTTIGSLNSFVGSVDDNRINDCACRAVGVARWLVCGN